VTTPLALLVEDSAEFVMLGTRLLEGEGYQVAVTGDGAKAVQLARTTRPELVLLDIAIPTLDGIEVCRRIRQFSDAYVIMLTARGDEVDRVLGLAVGADDYVTKPFSAREVSLRIRAMRRRPRARPASSLLDFGDLVIDPPAREVTVDAKAVELTRIEFDLLAMLAGSPRRTWTRTQLLAGVWGEDWFGDDHLVDVHLANLRRKLGERASAPRRLRTVRGVGYRFDP
jgi:DNA-binding response OmpR family regulator